MFDHLVVPITKLIDFIFFTPLNTSNKVIYASCILYPLLYYIEATIYGIFSSSHWYPYWFMNPSKISYLEVVLYFLALLVVFLLVIFAFTKIISVIKKKRENSTVLPISQLIVCYSNRSPFFAILPYAKTSLVTVHVNEWSYYFCPFPLISMISYFQILQISLPSTLSNDCFLHLFLWKRGTTILQSR